MKGAITSQQLMLLLMWTAVLLILVVGVPVLIKQLWGAGEGIVLQGTCSSQSEPACRGLEYEATVPEFCDGAAGICRPDPDSTACSVVCQT